MTLSIRLQRCWDDCAFMHVLSAYTKSNDENNVMHKFSNRQFVDQPVSISQIRVLPVNDVYEARKL